MLVRLLYICNEWLSKCQDDIIECLYDVPNILMTHIRGIQSIGCSGVALLWGLHASTDSTQLHNLPFAYLRFILSKSIVISIYSVRVHMQPTMFQCLCS